MITRIQYIIISYLLPISINLKKHEGHGGMYPRALCAQKPILTPVKLSNANLEVLQNAAETTIKANNCDKVVIATLNLNSIPNKFSFLAEIISNNIDIFVIEETTIDKSFPEGQCLIHGYKKPYRKDRNRNGGGIIV